MRILRSTFYKVVQRRVYVVAMVHLGLVTTLFN